ncbi:MAG: helix-turn-helix transcriptional regulator [Halanaerobiaceae bacterium]|nr:helix-turn-helix transcriptional regulator [Halanaerobiaceae bacterium]
MIDMKVVGERLREARLAMGYKQQKVADFIGKTREQISYYENGTREISLSLLTKLANLYGKSIDYFLGIDTKEPELQMAFRSDYVSKSDQEKIEWAINFVNNLYELKHL